MYEKRKSCQVQLSDLIDLKDTLASLVAQTMKASASNAGDPGSIPGWGRSPGERNGNHSSTLAWKIPWTEEPMGRLQPMGSQRVRHN